MVGSRPGPKQADHSVHTPYSCGPLLTPTETVVACLTMPSLTVGQLSTVALISQKSLLAQLLAWNVGVPKVGVTLEGP